jgi:hypothetical protein
MECRTLAKVPWRFDRYKKWVGEDSFHLGEYIRVSKCCQWSKCKRTAAGRTWRLNIEKCLRTYWYATPCLAREIHFRSLSQHFRSPVNDKHGCCGSHSLQQNTNAKAQSKRDTPLYPYHEGLQPKWPHPPLRCQRGHQKKRIQLLCVQTPDMNSTGIPPKGLLVISELLPPPACH